MTNYRVEEKGKRHTAEMIEETDSTTAKKDEAAKKQLGME